MCAIPSTLINKQQAFPTANIQWQCGCHKTTQQKRNMVALGVRMILIRMLLSGKKKKKGRISLLGALFVEGCRC